MPQAHPQAHERRHAAPARKPRCGRGGGWQDRRLISCAKINDANPEYPEICDPLSLSGITFSKSNWQRYPELRLSRFGSYLDLAVVLVDDDVVGDMHTQACADTRSLRSKEGFENAWLNLGRNPRPVVGDLDNDNVIVFGIRA